MLATILSKSIPLAKDKAIKDETVLRQIRGFRSLSGEECSSLVVRIEDSRTDHPTTALYAAFAHLWTISTTAARYSSRSVGFWM